MDLTPNTCRKQSMEAISGKGAFKHTLKGRLKFNTKWRLTEVEKHWLREEECRKEASFAVQREEVSAEWNDKHKGAAAQTVSH